MKLLSNRILLVPAVSVALMAAACTSSSPAPGSSSAPQGSPGSIVVDWATGNTTLDPAAACNQDDLSLIHNVYATLTQYGTKAGPDSTTEYDPTKIVPAFATSWDVADGGKSYTFHLREGAKFADGSVIDASAVKYSIERVLKIGTCATFYLQAGSIAPPLIKQVSAPDAKTVVFTLSRPNADFIAGLATPAASIVNPKVVEANGGVQQNTINKWMASHVAGSGAYTLESYEPNSKAVLKANPNYYGQQPANKQIEINYTTAASTLLLKAKSGAADVTLGMPLQSVKSISGDGCCRVVANEAPLFAQVALKNTSAPLSNVKLREALTRAVPYNDILTSVAYGYGKLFYGPIVPNAAGYDATDSDPIPTDLAKAKSVLAESGVQTPVNLTAIVNATNPGSVQLATVIQGVWKQIGVNLTIQQLAPSDFTPKYTGGDYQVAINIEGPGVPTAGYQLTLTSSCGSKFNNAAVCVPGLDTLLNQARASTDPSSAASIYAEITKQWRGQWPRIPLYAAQNVAVLGKSVTNYSYAKFLDFSSWTVSH